MQSSKKDHFFVPLSEAPLNIFGGHEIAVGNDNWQSEIVLSPGEQRYLTFAVRVPAGHAGTALGVLRVPAGARLTLAIELRVGAEAEWSSVLLVQGGGEVVIERQTSSIGQKAKVRLATVASLDGHARLQVSDDVRCEAPQTTVSVRMHTVLREAAQADTRARIVVGEGATGSEVDESLCHLLFGGEVRARALPELEVAQKDIRCRHRSFIGQPKDAEQFFLLSRGLAQDKVHELLTQGFFQSALAGVPEAFVAKTFDELKVSV